MNNERLAIGQELAFEASRLTDELGMSDLMRRVFDFESTPTMVYRDQPWGLIGISYRRQYARIDGNLRYSPSTDAPENPEVACISVETRHRSLRTTGEILCDREYYEIHLMGDIKTSISKGELTDAQVIRQGGPFSGTPLVDKSSEVFGIKDFPTTATSEQARNTRLLVEMSDKLHTANRERSEEISHQVKRLEYAGEQPTHTRFDVSIDDLKNLLGRLRLLETTDRLGQVELVSIVDKSDINA